MDINLQIQGIKSTIDNMKLQIENIEIQNNNPLLQMMKNQVGDQLLNLSIQMLNTGIQLFNYSINLAMDKNKFFMQLQIISEQINSKINSFNAEKINQQIIQQQMMQQPMIQQQMEHNQIGLGKKINAIFLQLQFGKKKINFVVDEDITIKQLLDKYMERVYGYENKEIRFIVNATILERNNSSKLLDFLRICVGDPPCITVIK